MLTLLVGALIVGPPGELGNALLMGAGWVINLAVAEWAIRKRPAPGDLFPGLHRIPHTFLGRIHRPLAWISGW